MIKRPLLLLLGAYVLGGLLYELSFIIRIILALALLCFLIFFWFRQSVNRYDFFLFFIPITFLLGAVFMWNQKLPGPVDQALENGPVYTSCEGTIANILQKDDTYQLLLSDVSYNNSLLKFNSNHNYHNNSTIYVYIKEMPKLELGNRVSVSGKLSLFTSPTNPGQFDERFYHKLQNIDYRMMAMELKVLQFNVNYCAQGLYLLRNRMKEVYNSLGENTASVLNAMLLGDTKNLEPEIKELYQAAGISHVISISGMHITLLGMAIFSLVAMLLGRKWATATAVLFILFYGILTGFSVSTNRAVVMMIIFLGAGMVGRTYDLLSAISLSALLILLQEPMQIYNTGFLLSYGAILGIGLSYPILISAVPVEEWKKREEVKTLSISSRSLRYLCRLRTNSQCKLVKLLMFQFAVQSILYPILLVSFYRIPTYSCLMNLLVVPMMDYVIIFGLPAGFLGCFFLPIGRFFLASPHYIIEFCNRICGLTYYLPLYYYVVGKPTQMELYLYAILIILGLLLVGKGKRAGILIILLGMVVLVIPWPNKGMLTVTALDVGQGDCYVLKTPNEHVYLIDGGSSDVSEVGTYRILPFLYSSGISKVDYLFVTHCDNDHISGVLELLEASRKGECQVGQLALPQISYMDENYDALVVAAKECEVPVVKLKGGDSLKEGELRIDCLHPALEYTPVSANDYSLVLSISFREFDMLFTGDVEKEGEEYIRIQEKLKQYEVLKVAHHGSKNSTGMDFLEEISPQIGLISCSSGNRYGHPHKELLDRLGRVGCKYYVTKDSGAITLTTDGTQVWMEEYCENNK